VRADLHTHSYCSDGTDSPRELVRAAAGAGLDLVALTDHDVADGWPEARAAAEESGIDFLAGMEISCAHDGAGVHLLAYGLDPTHPGLTAELDRVLAGRRSRLPGVLQRLGELGIEIDEADVRAVAGHAVSLGRPHVADAMVAAGVVADRDEAFDRYLMPGRPGYVPRYGAPLLEALRLVEAAGGVAVVAHPWSRGSRRVLTISALADLAGSGLTGVEVWHGDHTGNDQRELAGLARDLDLVATGSSDYHGSGKVGHDLGSFTTPTDQLERLEVAMATARAGAR
jgi:3',5'-nucleoside bisphosphate phosphatase